MTNFYYDLSHGVTGKDIYASLQRQQNVVGLWTEPEIIGCDTFGYKVHTSRGEHSTYATRSCSSPQRFEVDMRGLDRVLEPLFDFGERNILLIHGIDDLTLQSLQFRRLVQTYDQGSNAFYAGVRRNDESSDPLDIAGYFINLLLKGRPFVSFNFDKGTFSYASVATP